MIITQSNVNKIANRVIKRCVEPNNKAEAESRIFKMKFTAVKRGNFCVVVATDESQEMYVGVAKRMPNDKENDEIGLSIALTRAIESIFAKV